MTYALNIFETLEEIDARNFEYYAGLSDEQKKGFKPPVVLRWTSAVKGTQAAYYIWLTNELANINFYDLYEHPELQFKLLAACGSGRRQKHEWINFPTKKAKENTVQKFLAKYWPDANEAELNILLSQFTDATFYEFAETSGSPPQEIKEVIEAYDRHVGKAVKPKKQKAQGSKR